MTVTDSNEADAPTPTVWKPVACPHCSKPNPPDAKWCWVCYGELGESIPYATLAGPRDDQSARREKRRLRKSRILNVILGSLTTVFGTLAAVAATALVACAVFILFVGSIVISVVISILEICSGPPGG